MKTYKLIIELSDSMLEKMASIEELLKESNSGVTLAQLITSKALIRKLEEEGSATVNMDAIVDVKELDVMKHAVISVGAVVITQEGRIKRKKRTRINDFGA